MSEKNEKRGKKRSKAFYRKSAHGGKKPRGGSNVLEPGIKGFLVMCNNNESQAVKESYNILNEYADLLHGQEQLTNKSHQTTDAASSEEDSENEDIEKAMKKEIDSIKNTTATQRRFQNVQTKAKNCVFIRSSVDPVKLILNIMEDIAQKGLKKARFAARILPIIGTCKANTSDIEKLARDVFTPIFAKDNTNAPSSYTVMFKIRNNNASTCGKTSVIPALTKVVSEINPSVRFSWTDFEVAVLVEVVCTVCCLGIAPSYVRLRKYNLQELSQGPRTIQKTSENVRVDEACENETAKETCENETVNETCEKLAPENETAIDIDKEKHMRQNEEPTSVDIIEEMPNSTNVCAVNKVCVKLVRENEKASNTVEEKQTTVDSSSENSVFIGNIVLQSEKANENTEEKQAALDNSGDFLAELKNGKANETDNEKQAFAHPCAENRILEVHDLPVNIVPLNVP